MGKITVTIKNWGKYNPRPDSKHPSWLRLNNDIFECEAFFGINKAAIFTWIFLLTRASKQNSGSFTVNVEYAAHYLGCSEAEFLHHLELLISTDACTSSHEPAQARTDLPATNGRTDGRTNEQNPENQKPETAAPDVAVVAFEKSVEELNSRKQRGKKQGGSKSQSSVVHDPRSEKDQPEWETLKPEIFEIVDKLHPYLKPFMEIRWAQLVSYDMTRKYLDRRKAALNWFASDYTVEQWDRYKKKNNIEVVTKSQLEAAGFSFGPGWTC